MVNFNYFSGGESVEEDREVSKYAYERDLAFFAANFNYSKSEFNELTEKEKLFIRKAWEDRTILDTELMRNAMLNAITNALRKKNTKFVDLHKKKRPQAKADKTLNERLIADIKAAEKRDGKSWVMAIHRANRIGIPRERRN